MGINPIYNADKHATSRRPLFCLERKLAPGRNLSASKERLETKPATNFVRTMQPVREA